MKFLFIFFLLPLKLFSQDITGVWTGTLYNDTTKQYLKYQLAISEDGKKLNGYSYTIFLINGVENIGVKSIKVKKSGGDFLIEDDKLIYNNYTEPPAKGVRIYSDLVLTQTDSVMMLAGPWKTNRTKVYESITGRISVEKKKNIEGTLIIAKLENLGLAKSLSFMNYECYASNTTIASKPSSPAVTKNASDETERNNLVADNSTTAGQRADSGFKSNLSVNNSPLNKTNASATPQNVAKSPSAVTNEKKNAGTNAHMKANGIVSNTSQPSGIDTSAQRSRTNAVTSHINATEKKDLAATNPSTRDTTIFKKADSLAIDNNFVASTKKSNEAVKEANKKLPSAHATEQLLKKEKVEQTASAKNLQTNDELIHAPALPVPKAAAEISSRKIETIKSVDIKSDSLLLTLYDNGEIDGDTVSVLMNGNVIMPMQGLTAKGISKTVYLTPEMGDSIELIMYAENLGSIPPNTGLLVVHDGESIYEVRFSGDLKKNSAIILRRKKEN